MENKLNKPALENYARQVARKLCSDFFNNEKRTISGKEIVGFMPIGQVNYFVLKNLFTLWKSEIEHLKKSPYFDYEKKDVESALQNLMNVLSNHIVVKHDAFENLLSGAIEETMYLSLSPYHYFKQYIFYPEKQKITLLEIKELTKYMKINSLFFNEFIEKIEAYKMQTFQIADVLGYFQQAYYNNNDKFDSFEPIVGAFSKIAPLDLATLVTDLKKKSDVAPTPLEVYESQQKEKEPKSSGVASIIPIKLSLNQKIMFLKELFKGDTEQMEHTMARLESAGNLDNAKYILGFFNWDKENEAVQEFYDVIEVKFK